jgi:hypothetical protein
MADFNLRVDPGTGGAQGVEWYDSSATGGGGGVYGGGGYSGGYSPVGGGGKMSSVGVGGGYGFGGDAAQFGSFDNEPPLLEGTATVTVSSFASASCPLCSSSGIPNYLTVISCLAPESTAQIQIKTTKKTHTHLTYLVHTSLAKQFLVCIVDQLTGDPAAVVLTRICIC